VALSRHRKEGLDRRLHGGGADGDQRQVVERADQQIPDRYSETCPCEQMR
jgi:hypothetical protein